MINNKKFFNNIDTLTYKNPEKLATEYLYFLIHEYSCKNIDMTTGNIIIASDDNSLEYITKRCLLISDTLHISTNTFGTSQIIYKDISTSNFGYISDYFTYNNNLFSLGKWIQKSRSLLINGMLSYIPNGYIATYDCDITGNEIYGGYIVNINNLSIAPELVTSSKKIIELSHNINSKFIEPIFSLQIPIIDTVDIENFSNIVLDNIDELNSFKTYLKHSMLSINCNDKTALEKLSLELQMQLNDIKHTYNNTIYKYKINSAIGSIAMVTAILFCINPNISDVIKIASGVGSGYGLLDFLRSNQEYFTLNENSKNNNCYFLWLLQK